MRVFELKISDKVSGLEVCNLQFEATDKIVAELIGAFYDRAQEDGANIEVTDHKKGLGH